MRNRKPQSEKDPARVEAGAKSAAKNTEFVKKFRRKNGGKMLDHNASSDFANSLDAVALSYPLPEIPDPTADAHPSIIHYSLTLAVTRRKEMEQEFVLLVKRPSDARIFPGHWNLPGGVINTPHETVEKGAMREFKEESGWPCEAPRRCGTMLITRGEQAIVIHCVKVHVEQVDLHRAAPSASEHPSRWHLWGDIQRGSVAPIPRNLRIVIPLMMREVENWILYFPYSYFPQWDQDHSIREPASVIMEIPPGNAILCY